MVLVDQGRCIGIKTTVALSPEDLSDAVIRSGVVADASDRVISSQFREVMQSVRRLMLYAQRNEHAVGLVAGKVTEALD